MVRPKMKDFKSVEAYHKFLAYEHIHHVNPLHGPYPKIEIKGKIRQVKH